MSNKRKDMTHQHQPNGSWKTSTWLFALTILVLFALVIFFFMRGLGKDPKVLPSVMTGKPLPTFALPSLLNDASISNDDMPTQPFLLNVWGSWCAACYQEHPYLLDIAQHIPIVGLNWPADNPTEQRDGREFLSELGNPYQLVITDTQGTLITDLGVYGAPETFLISADKQILYRHAGVLTPQVWQDTFLTILQSQETN